MSTITTEDGTEIYYKDWGEGPVVTFSHGWPLNADAWDGQLLFFAQQGFRVVAHDRRGHGRSSQPSSGNDMDSYADDLAAVINALDLRDVTLVGHSTGGGEVTRYIARHGSERVAKAVLIAAVPPIMIKTSANPEGLPREVFDDLRSQLVKDRSQFYRDLALQFYGANRSGSEVSQGTLDQFWLWGMQVGLKNAYECIEAFSETDFTEDLRRSTFRHSLHARTTRSSPSTTPPVNGSPVKDVKEIYYPVPHGLANTLRIRSTTTCWPSSADMVRDLVPAPEAARQGSSVQREACDNGAQGAPSRPGRRRDRVRPRTPRSG